MIRYTTEQGVTVTITWTPVGRIHSIYVRSLNQRKKEEETDNVRLVVKTEKPRIEVKYDNVDNSNNAGGKGSLYEGSDDEVDSKRMSSHMSVSRRRPLEDHHDDVEDVEDVEYVEEVIEEEVMYENFAEDKISKDRRSGLKSEEEDYVDLEGVDVGEEEDEYQYDFVDECEVEQIIDNEANEEIEKEKEELSDTETTDNVFNKSQASISLRPDANDVESFNEVLEEEFIQPTSQALVADEPPSYFESEEPSKTELPVSTENSNVNSSLFNKLKSLQQPQSESPIESISTENISTNNISAGKISDSISENSLDNHVNVLGNQDSKFSAKEEDRTLPGKLKMPPPVKNKPKGSTSGTPLKQSRAASKKPPRQLEETKAESTDFDAIMQRRKKYVDTMDDAGRMLGQLAHRDEKISGNNKVVSKNWEVIKDAIRIKKYLQFKDKPMKAPEINKKPAINVIGPPKTGLHRKYKV